VSTPLSKVEKMSTLTKALKTILFLRVIFLHVHCAFVQYATCFDLDELLFNISDAVLQYKPFEATTYLEKNTATSTTSF